ncbi:MAG TPA: hypothetical protein VF805_05685, partial [Anaeromyxobacteraceae bacterium]
MPAAFSGAAGLSATGCCWEITGAQTASVRSPADPSAAVGACGGQAGASARTAGRWRAARTFFGAAACAGASAGTVATTTAPGCPGVLWAASEVVASCAFWVWAVPSLSLEAV